MNPIDRFRDASPKTKLLVVAGAIGGSLVGALVAFPLLATFLRYVVAVPKTIVETIVRDEPRASTGRV